ncbi:MAG: FAD-dependent oxidoreductase [Acidobacteriota bacterium]
MRRRAFLSSLAGAGLSLGASRKRVVIAGAGLAGLCAAYELRKLGHDVVIVEAQLRPGGRVLTLREGLTPGVHAEAGATRIPTSHDLTLRYVRHFDLPLEPLFYPGLFDVYHLRGENFVMKPGVRHQWPLALSPEEQALGPDGLYKRYVHPAIAAGLAEARSNDVPKSVLQGDSMTMARYLRKKGLSADAIELTMLGFDPDLGSAAWTFLDEINHEAPPPVRRIQGGNDRLPRAFAASLAPVIRYGRAAAAFGQNEKEAWLVVNHGGQQETLRADHVICTLPFSVCRKMFAEARLPEKKLFTIESQPYSSTTKVYLQMTSQFWRKQGLSGWANTDLLSERFWALGQTDPDARGLLKCYNIGPKADRLDTMTDAQRQQAVLEDAERVFPGAKQHYEGGVSKSWMNDPFQRGSFAQYDPGQIGNIAINRQREGRIHFAGEHTSRYNAWMQGAFESALRVVDEIRQAG